jgi:hypothetical protein
VNTSSRVDRRDSGLNWRVSAGSRGDFGLAGRLTDSRV